MLQSWPGHLPPSLPLLLSLLGGKRVTYLHTYCLAWSQPVENSVWKEHFPCIPVIIRIGIDPSRMWVKHRCKLSSLFALSIRREGEPHSLTNLCLPGRGVITCNFTITRSKCWFITDVSCPLFAVLIQLEGEPYSSTHLCLSKRSVIICILTVTWSNKLPPLSCWSLSVGKEPHTYLCWNWLDGLLHTYLCLVWFWSRSTGNMSYPSFGLRF